MNWNDVRHFLALARLRSVRAAGQALGVSHSTVARRVEALEERLAARLFDRTRDGYILTAAGRQMLPVAERIEQDMAALERGLVGQDERLSGEVSLTCCDNFVASLLLRDLSEFCARYPDIELRVHIDSRHYNLAKREADIAVRALLRGGQPPEYLIGQKLVPLVLASYVGAAHAEARDPVHEGADARWLAFEDRVIHEAMIAETGYAALPSWGGISSMELMIEALREGMGIARLPTYVGDAAAGLRRLSRPDLQHVADLWMLSHPDLRANARFRATRVAVAESLRGRVALFEGRRSGATGCHEFEPRVPDDRSVQ